MQLHLLYDRGPERCDMLCDVPDDEELGWFMQQFCEQLGFDFDQYVFFWQPEDSAVHPVQLSCSKTPLETTTPLGFTLAADKERTIHCFHPDLPIAPRLRKARPGHPALDTLTELGTRDLYVEPWLDRFRYRKAEAPRPRPRPDPGDKPTPKKARAARP